MYVYFPLRIEKVIKKVCINYKSHSNFAPRTVLLKIFKLYKLSPRSLILYSEHILHVLYDLKIFLTMNHILSFCSTVHVKMADIMAQLGLLKEFVKLCKKDPGILHQKELAFFSEWIER